MNRKLDEDPKATWEAHLRGWNDFEFGRPITDNPFKEDEILRTAYEMGWTNNAWAKKTGLRI